MLKKKPAQPFVKKIHRTELFENTHWRNHFLSLSAAYHSSMLYVTDVGDITCHPGGDLPFRVGCSNTTWHFCLVHSGSGEVFFKGQRNRFRRGDVLVLPPNELQATLLFDFPVVRFWRLIVHDSIAVHALCSPYCPEVTILRPEQRDFVWERFENIFQLLEKPQDERTSLRIGVETFAFLSEIERQCFRTTFSSTIQGIRQDIGSFPCEQYTIKGLAARCNMTVRTFQRKFKDEIGCSPLAFIILGRIGWARHLLQTTTLPLQEIAGQCRFGSVSLFSNTFKKYTGMPPGKYRKSIYVRPSVSSQSALASGMKNKKMVDRLLTGTRQRILWLIQRNCRITIREMSCELKINPSAIQKHIRKLKDTQMLEYRGSARNGYWVILSPR